MFRELASVDDILPGGMKAYEVDGNEIVICNVKGRFYAFERRCGHMSAPLDLGTANDHIITCPLHSVQFDARTGEALCGPLFPYTGDGPAPKTHDNFGNWLELLMKHVKTCDIKTFEVRVDMNIISIDL